MKYFFCLFICYQYFITNAAAQVVRDSFGHTIYHYTDEEGLPQNSINEIIEDEFGFTWFSTEGGMVRFDGKDFKVFDKMVLPCVRSNRFSIILNMPALGKFAMTENGKFVKIEKGTAFCHPTQGDSLRQQVRKWYKIAGKRGVMITGSPAKYTDYKILQNYIIPIGMQQYILRLPDVIIFKDKDASDSIHFNGNKFSNFFLVGEELYHLKDSCVLSNIQRKAVRECDITGDLLSDNTYKKQKSKLVILWNIAMRSTLIYYNKSFYEVERLPDGTLSTRLIFSGFDLQSEQIISHYYNSKDKRLFLGSAINGLFVVHQKLFKIFVENPKINKSYYGISAYDKISVVTPKGVRFSSDSVISLLGQLPNDSISAYTIQVDRLDNVWVKGNNFLFQYDKKFNLQTRMEFPQRLAGLYCSADDSTLWIGQKDSGLYKLNILARPYTGKVRLVSSTIPPVASIVSISKEQLLIGTNKGLYILNVISNKLVCIDQFKNKYIRSIFVKDAGEIWITTYGDGIFLLRNRKLSHMPYDRNKSLLAPHCMILDKKNFFWISTNKGLVKASRKDLLSYADHLQEEVFYQYFGKENGLNTNEFNGGCLPCGVHLPNGSVVLPSLDGLVWINSLTINAELPDHHLLLDWVKVDHKMVTERDTLTLPRKFDNLSVHLSTVYFGSRKNVLMSYMLKRNGKKDEWYPVNDNDLISFSSLPSGFYELRIRKLNGFGKDNYTTVSLKFIVPPAFYETIWFKMLVVLFVVLIIYLYARVRTYYILKKNRLLDLLIARRTRTLTNTLHALKISEASLRRQTQMQEMLIAAISHDIRSPMKYLTMVSKRMQQQLQKKDYESLTAFNEGIQDTASKVYTILDNLITYISIQLKVGDIRNETVDLFKLITEKISLFAAIAETNHTKIRSSIEPGTTVRGDEALLAVIIHNLIDNAVKFTASGTIEIYEEKGGGDTFVLVIKDTGTGIPKELVGWLNANSEKGLNVETISGHKGMGLMIIKELLTSAAANLNVASDEHGTIIRMSFKKDVTTDL